MEELDTRSLCSQLHRLERDQAYYAERAAIARRLADELEQTAADIGGRLHVVARLLEKLTEVDQVYGKRGMHG
jgi:hypothetical protein